MIQVMHDALGRSPAKSASLAAFSAPKLASNVKQAMPREVTAIQSGDCAFCTVGLFVACDAPHWGQNGALLRLVLESNIASLAAGRISAAEIAELQQLQDAIEEQGTCMTEENLSRIRTLSREFHRVIGGAGQSGRLIAMLGKSSTIKHSFVSTLRMKL